MKNQISNLHDFDESLLEINLQKSVEQRVLSHDAALEVARELQRAVRELYERPHDLEMVKQLEWIKGKLGLK